MTIREQVLKYLDELENATNNIEAELGIKIESNIELPAKRRASSKWMKLYEKMEVGQSVLLTEAEARSMQASLSAQKLGSNITSRKVSPEQAGGKNGMVRVFKVADTRPDAEIEIEEH